MIEYVNILNNENSERINQIRITWIKSIPKKPENHTADKGASERYLSTTTKLI